MKIFKLLIPLVGAKNSPFHIDENSPVRFITPGVFLDVTSSYRDIFGKLRTYHKKVLVDPAKLPKKVLKAIKDGKIDKFPNLSFAPTARKSPKTCINGRPYRFGCRYLRKTSYNSRYRTFMRNWFEEYPSHTKKEWSPAFINYEDYPHSISYSVILKLPFKLKASISNKTWKKIEKINLWD